MYNVTLYFFIYIYIEKTLFFERNKKIIVDIKSKKKIFFVNNILVKLKTQRRQILKF